MTQIHAQKKQNTEWGNMGKDPIKTVDLTDTRKLNK
jgi:hypothetical protein